MADVFVSYAKEDRERAEAVAHALESCGWTVWWDLALVPGTRFPDVIEHELNNASCVVVLWSTAALKSDWVNGEAMVAKERGVLVSAPIDASQAPLGFRPYHIANLAGWSGSVEATEFRNLQEGVALRTRRATAAVPVRSAID